MLCLRVEGELWEMITRVTSTAEETKDGGQVRLGSPRGEKQTENIRSVGSEPERPALITLPVRRLNKTFLHRHRHSECERI